MALVEMDGGGVEHFLAANFLAEVADSFNRAHAHPAVESALKAFASRREKIAGPSVETDAVDKVRLTLRWLQVMFAAGIVGVADAAVAVAIVDAVLAPNLPLANVNAFFGGEVVLIFRIHEPRNNALRAIVVAHHF